MMFRLKFFFVLLLVVSVIIGCSKKEEEKASMENEARLAAKIGDWELTRNELDEILRLLPEQQKTKYDTPAGRAELANRLIEEELYHQEAMKMNMNEQEGVLKELREAERRILITAYYRNVVQERAKPTDEEMHDFYEENPDRFTIQPMMRAQHIFSKDRQKLVDLKKQIDNGEEKMTTLAHKYSEDQITKPDGGDLGYFNPGGYVRFVGYDKEFTEKVFELEVGVVSDPIEIKKGFSIVRVNEKKPARLRPYEEVKEEIEKIMIRNRIEGIKADIYEELSAKYAVDNYLERELKLTQRSAEELWNLAQTSTDSYQRLKAYEELVDKYPDSEYAPQALFMVGFVYAEELKDQFMADRTFNRVINEYKDSDVAESARWMIRNLGKPLPDFENLDELHKKVTEESGD